MLPIRRAIQLACAALAFAAPAVRAAACPVTEMSFNAGTPFGATPAVFDTTISGTRGLGYDVSAATLSLRADGEFKTFVRVHDTFVPIGLAPGAQLLTILQLDVEGTIGTTGCGGANCWGSITARITTANGLAQETAEANVFAGPPVPKTIALGLPIVLVGGQSLDAALELSASGSANHQEIATGTWSFPILPSGVGIVSCRGFVRTPVPVVPATWGRVKAAYR